jgi:hypothetical protein
MNIPRRGPTPAAAVAAIAAVLEDHPHRDPAYTAELAVRELEREGWTFSPIRPTKPARRPSPGRTPLRESPRTSGGEIGPHSATERNAA